MKIRAKSIAYGSKKKKKNAENERLLEEEIRELEIKTILTEGEKAHLEKSKADLISVREKRMEGVLLRSRTRWITEGEKITNYFCSLKKRNFVSNQILKIDTGDNVITEEKYIETEVNNFYQEL